MIYIGSFTDRCVLLLILIALCSLSWWIYAPLWQSTGMPYVEIIAANGTILKTWALHKPNANILPQIIIKGLQGDMLLGIENGSVRVLASSCAQQRCVLNGKIDSIGQSIVCVPNRIIIHISSTDINKDDNSENNYEWDALSE